MKDGEARTVREALKKYRPGYVDDSTNKKVRIGGKEEEQVLENKSAEMKDQQMTSRAGSS